MTDTPNRADGPQPAARPMAHVDEMAKRISDLIGSHPTNLHPKVEVWKSAKRFDDEMFPLGYYLYEAHYSDYYDRVLYGPDSGTYVTRCPSMRLQLSAAALTTPEELCWQFASEYTRQAKRVKDTR